MSKLYRTIVGYGVALVATVEAGAACSGPRRGPMREGPTPAFCDENPCAVHGVILDERGAPVAGATIEYAGQTTTSDAGGEWTFPPVRGERVGSGASGNTITAKATGGRVVSQEYEGRSDGRYPPSPVRLQFLPLPPVPPPAP